MRLLVIFAALPLLSCGGGGTPEISAADAWTREVATGQSMASAYVTISNHGDGADKLVAAESPAAVKATLHSSSSADGIARMRPITGGLEIPAHSEATFKPGGNHIMLEGLRQPLKAGQTIELTLAFEESGRRPIAVRVLPATAEDMHMHGMSM